MGFVVFSEWFVMVIGLERILTEGYLFFFSGFGFGVFEWFKWCVW